MNPKNSNPISLELIDKNTYRLSIKLDSWEISQTITEQAINLLLEEIHNATGLTKISKSFTCNGIDAKEINNFWKNRNNWKLCNTCNQKWKACHDCVVKCESPLERDLLLSLRNSNLEPIMQRRINKDGSFYDFPKEIDYDNILTVPDFYFENDTTKLCIYADGHTYHNKTEKQAMRDRNIDRELQNLGFKVLRYTGQEIRNHSDLVVENINISLKK